jgi:hypothetical protein
MNTCWSNDAHARPSMREAISFLTHGYSPLLSPIRISISTNGSFGSRSSPVSQLGLADDQRETRAASGLSSNGNVVSPDHGLLSDTLRGDLVVVNHSPVSLISEPPSLTVLIPGQIPVSSGEFSDPILSEETSSDPDRPPPPPPPPKDPIPSPVISSPADRSHTGRSSFEDVSPLSRSKLSRIFPRLKRMPTGEAHLCGQILQSFLIQIRAASSKPVFGRPLHEVVTYAGERVPCMLPRRQPVYGHIPILVTKWYGRYHPLLLNDQSMQNPVVSL